MDGCVIWNGRWMYGWHVVDETTCGQRSVDERDGKMPQSNLWGVSLVGGTQRVPAWAHP